MSATNHTTNYELPIFVGTDKPAWLVDWNGAMVAIDQAIHQAEGKADQAGTDIGGIESSISTINSTLTSINSAVSQLRIDTNANTGSINTITSLIGNGEPTTTDKTIIGAINELASDFTLNNSATGTITPKISTTLLDESEIKSLLNDNGSIGKIYGGISFVGAIDIPANDYLDIADVSNLGLPTIDTAYSIYIGFASLRLSSNNTPSFKPVYLRFNTNGTITIRLRNVASSVSSVNLIGVSLPPCIYFLKDLGD